MTLPELEGTHETMPDPAPPSPFSALTSSILPVLIGPIVEAFAKAHQAVGRAEAQLELVKHLHAQDKATAIAEAVAAARASDAHVAGGSAAVIVDRVVRVYEAVKPFAQRLTPAVVADWSESEVTIATEWSRERSRGLVNPTPVFLAGYDGP